MERATRKMQSSKSKMKKKAHTIVEVASQDGIGKCTPKVAKQRQPTVKAPSKDNTTKGKSGHNTSQDKPSKSKKTVRPKPNYKSPDNHDINLDLETLGVKKMKEECNKLYQESQEEIIEDSVEDGVGPSKRYKTVDSVPKKTIEVKVVPPAPSTSAATADGARKSQRKIKLVVPTHDALKPSPLFYYLVPAPMFLRKPHQLSQYVPSAALTPTIDCSCPRSARAQTRSCSYTQALALAICSLSCSHSPNISLPLSHLSLPAVSSRLFYDGL
ncbi:hypothetical protein JB92DRAFT_3138504 [Gautieria morchelliformis]|nr:hypothetical protein JB92DRAFT_3138504 [Gautieria morchelliformis]